MKWITWELNIYVMALFPVIGGMAASRNLHLPMPCWNSITMAAVKEQW
jgi:hypothetical protein